MKKIILLFLLCFVQTCVYAQEEYYPEGTKWTEIRLDTLKYNSWYSKVGEDWVPNFETIEYRVQGEYIDDVFEYKYKKVYTNGPEWTDSLTLLISNGESHGNSNCIFVKIPENQGDIICPTEIYQFDWSVGKRLWFQNMLEANTTCFPPCGLFNYGIIDEIKEGDFGGVRPLKYVDLSGKAPTDPERPWLDYADTNGGRIIQGIGITEWNDGECLFGPPDPYYAGYGWRGDYKSRHYRSMLVHFERNNEVLYDVWPKKPHQPQSFLEGNPIWVYKYEHLPTPRSDDWMKYWVDTGNRSYTYYFLGGRKEIEGKVYTMMGEVGCSREGEITLNRWLPVREENGIVYTITDSLPGVLMYEYNEDYPIPYQQQGKECVLYNFSAEIGEALNPQDEWSTVESYSTLQLMDGTESRVLKTRGEYYDLYEKLGFLNDGQECGVMDPLRGLLVATNGHIYASHLNAYYQNDMMLYKAPDAQDGLCVNDTCWTRDDAHDYAISYKADPRQEEVFSYIRQLQKGKEPVAFTAGQMATIILPTEPDASKGKYYRLDRVEDNHIIFEQELQPQAHVPYIIVPNEDFSIDLNTLDLAGCYQDTVSIAGISFIGSYVSETFDYPDGFYIDFIDITSDCQFNESCVIGALRAYLLVRWDDPYNQGGTRVPPLNKMGIVLRDYETGITSSLEETGKGAVIYNLAGQRLSKPQKGIYIEGGKKIAVK